MMTPVPQSPTGDTGPVTQVQGTEQNLPSNESSKPADHGGNSSLVQDMPKVSNSVSDSSDKAEMTDGQSSSDASPLASHGTRPHSRVIKHVARTSSSAQGDPSSGFIFGKAQPVQADLMGKFKKMMPQGNPTPPSAQPHHVQGSTERGLGIPPVAQVKHNNSPMDVPFPMAGNQKANHHAEATTNHTSVTNRPLSRRAQDAATIPPRLRRGQRAKTDDLEISTGPSNGVLADIDPNTCKLPTPQQGIMPDKAKANAATVKGTSNDPRQLVNKKRRHQSSMLVDNGPTPYDTQVQIKVFEAYHATQKRYCSLAQQYEEQGSFVEKLVSQISAKDNTIQSQQSDIAELDEVSQSLEQMYEEKSKLLEEKEAALARLQQKKPQWELKVKRLTEALNGLCNDHDRLRETGDKLLARVNLIDADEESIRDALLAIHASNDADRAKSKDMASKYHKHIEHLEKTILALQSQKTNSPQDAEAEREKSARLEAELTKITNSHEKMRQEYAKSYLELNTKLKTLLERPQATNTIVERTSSDNSSPQLEECLAMLRTISRQEHVKPSDVAKLETSMGQYTQSVKDSINEYAEKSEKANATAQSLARSVQAELRSMSGNIVKAEDLREQVAEHRETKASLGEQLQAAKLRLVETQVRLGSFEEKDRDNRQRIQEFEAELKQARETSRDPPEIMLRLHELEHAKAKAENEKASMSHELQKMHQHLHQKENDVSDLQAKATGLQSEVERKTQAEEKLRCSHVILQKQMEQGFEAAKRKLLEDKDIEVENTLLDVRNEKQQLLYGLEQYKRQILELKEKQAAPNIEAMNKERQQEEVISRLEREKQSEVATNRALCDTVKTLEAKLDDRSAQAKIDDLTKVVEKLRGQKEELEEFINASESDKQDFELLQQHVKTLEQRLQQAPSLEKYNGLRMLVQDLKTEIGNLQGQVNRAQSESKSRKQEVKQLKALIPATPGEAALSTVDVQQGGKNQRRVVGDSQEKEKEPGRGFQEILSSQSDEEDELNVTGVWPASPKASTLTQQQEQKRITLPPKKAVRVQGSSGRLYNPSTPRSSSGGEDAQQPPKAKGTIRNQSSGSASLAKHSNGSTQPDLTESQEITSSHGSSRQAEKPKVVGKHSEPLPEDPEARWNLERIARGASNLNLKRDQADANLDTHVGTGSKRSKARTSSTLGPIVADSQSPNHLLNGRGRKVSATYSRRQSYKESAMAARFKAERKFVE